MAITVEAQKDRIIAHVGRNTPATEWQFKTFPPDKFPIHLHLLFSHRNLYLVEKLKSVFNCLSKTKIRYRKTANLYKTIYSLNCYFGDVTALEPVANALEDENIWKVALVHGDQQLTSQSLIESARLYLS